MRTTTDYRVPSDIPVGATAPRPGLYRATSAPSFQLPVTAPAVIPAKPISALPPVTANVSAYPIAKPIRISPLRISIRRDSSRSSEIGHSRRGSDTTDPRRESASIDSRRNSSKTDFRRRSSDRSSSRKESLASDRRKSSLISSSTRKSSIVSKGEYGYLAPQIVVEPPQPPPAGLSARRNGPGSLVLPPYSFPTSTPNTPYSPMESFYGRSNPSTPMPLEGDDMETPMMRYGLISPPIAPDAYTAPDRVTHSPPVFRQSFGQSPRKVQSTVSFRDRPTEIPDQRTQPEKITRPAHVSSPSRRPAEYSPHAHRRHISVEQQSTARTGRRQMTLPPDLESASPTRPMGKRQLTLPPQLDQLGPKRDAPLLSPIPLLSSVPPLSPITEPKLSKRVSEIYTETARPKIGRASSFTRFIQSKTQSFLSDKPRGSPRPTSMEHSPG